MEPQLPLLDDRDVEALSDSARRHPARGWHLDERTRAAGRQGLVEARKALQEAVRRAATREGSGVSSTQAA